MEKNSFSLLETVLSLIILSILVSGFIPFTYKSVPKPLSLNSISNGLILNQSNENTHLDMLDYELVGSTFQAKMGTTFLRQTYNDSVLSLTVIQAKQLPSNVIAFETFE